MQLLEAGNSVVATCRNPQRADALSELANTYKDRLTIVPLDVNDEGSVKVCNAPVLTSAHRQSEPFWPNAVFRLGAQEFGTEIWRSMCPSLQHVQRHELVSMM